MIEVFYFLAIFGCQNVTCFPVLTDHFLHSISHFEGHTLSSIELNGKIYV
jgi:hypothetical protein